MSLTKNDIQTIKEALQLEFEKMNKKFDDKIDAIDKKLENKFLEVNVRFEKNEETLEKVIRGIIAEIYDRHPSKEEFRVLQNRVTIIEGKIQRPQ